MWKPIALSGKHRKAMDRVGGAELILPWPPGLADGTRGAPLAEDEERDATPAEIAAAEQIVGPACAAAGLVPVRFAVAMLRLPGTAPRAGRPVERRLVVLITGRRWVHADDGAGGNPAPGRSCWYEGVIELA